jgi:hypothetical protein
MTMFSSQMDTMELLAMVLCCVGVMFVLEMLNVSKVIAEQKSDATTLNRMPS